MAPALLAPALAVLLGLAGCSQINAALSRQSAVVTFKPDTTVRTLRDVAAACSHVPDVRPLTASQTSGELDATYSVRYQASQATGADLAALKACLERFSAVSGVSIRDTASKG